MRATPKPPSWYDDQYDNRARIPGHPGILAHWAQASARALARHADIVELAYGADPSERLDVFPAVRPGSPVLVYVHGGYWRALDKRSQSFVAPPFVDAGAMVVLPGYALCPAVTIEHIVMQLVRALAWVHRHAADHGGDATRIVVAGHSAGGHLATMLLTCDWRQVDAALPVDLVKAALSISGLYELEPLRHAPFLAKDIRLTAASARRLSPAGMPAPTGSLVTVVGGDESQEFHRQAALIGKRWSAAVTAALSVPGRNHID
ncbi:MAG: alpha/beta hydrolase, partial [Caldimonas sp.]